MTSGFLYVIIINQFYHYKHQDKLPSFTLCSDVWLGTWLKGAKVLCHYAVKTDLFIIKWKLFGFHFINSQRQKNIDIYLKINLKIYKCTSTNILIDVVQLTALELLTQA